MRVLEGGRGHSRPLSPDLPAPRGGLVAAGGFSREQRAAWNRHVAWLVDLRLDSNVDSGNLEAGVRSFVLARLADRRLTRELAQKKLDLAKLRFYEGARDRAWGKYGMFLAKFGMTPADRARLSIDPPTNPEEASYFPPELSDAD